MARQADTVIMHEKLCSRPVISRSPHLVLTVAVPKAAVMLHENQALNETFLGTRCKTGVFVVSTTVLTLSRELILVLNSHDAGPVRTPDEGLTLTLTLTMTLTLTLLSSTNKDLARRCLW